MPQWFDESTVDQTVLTLRAAGCVFAEDEAAILLSSARDGAQLADMVAQRAGGRPLEYVVGWAEFCGLRISVDDGVFVPRRRTEFLVRQAAVLAREGAAHGGFAGLARESVMYDGASRLAAGRSPSAGDGDASGAVVLDMCCGSGALGLALLSELGGGELHAADIEPASVACARRNLAPLGGHVYRGDLFEPLPDSLRGRVTILLANTPYVPTDEIRLLPSEAKDYEPQVTLDGGFDGLEVQRRVAAGAKEWLAPGGHLLVESSEQQAGESADIFRAHGLAPRVVEDDDLGATVVIGTLER